MTPFDWFKLYNVSTNPNAVKIPLDPEEERARKEASKARKAAEKAEKKRPKVDTSHHGLLFYHVKTLSMRFGHDIRQSDIDSGEWIQATPSYCIEKRDYYHGIAPTPHYAAMCHKCPRAQLPNDCQGKRLHRRFLWDAVILKYQMEKARQRSRKR